MSDIWLILEVGYNKQFIVEYCSRDVTDDELGDDNLSLLSIFLNLHILNMANILYSEWPKYSKCVLNDIKTTNLLYFVLFHNYPFNLSLISVFQNF